MATYSSVIIYISLFFGLYYQIFILITFFDDQPKDVRTRKASAKAPNLPSVTIIVPCFNEERTLEKTVLSLLGLNYPKNKLFVTIVDDGSKDATYTKALELTKYKNVKAFTQINGGKYTALNFGIINAKTDIVGCLDADSTVHPDSLLKMIPLFNKKRTMSVIPAIKACDSNTILQKMQSAEYNIGIFSKKMLGRLDALHVTPGPFSLFKRELFNKIGHFKHAHNTEDMEMACRIQSNHFKIAYCSEAYVYTITPSTFSKLYKQRTRWTYGFLKNIQDYKYMVLNPKYGNVGMLTLPFAMISSIISLLIFGNTIYNLLAYAVESIQKYLLVGFSLHSFSFDIFFINTNALSLLTIMLFISSLALIALAWKIVEGKIEIRKDIVYFIAIYGFIAPIWLAKASFNVLTSKTAPWR